MRPGMSTPTAAGVAFPAEACSMISITWPSLGTGPVTGTVDVRSVDRALCLGPIGPWVPASPPSGTCSLPPLRIASVFCLISPSLLCITRSAPCSAAWCSPAFKVS